MWWLAWRHSAVTHLPCSSHSYLFVELNSSCCFIVSFALYRGHNCTWCSLVMTHHSCPPQGWASPPPLRPPPLLTSTEQFGYLCVCAYMCQSTRGDRQRAVKQTDWQTGSLFVGSQTLQTLPFCDDAVYLQVWMKARGSAVWERVLPEHVEGVTWSSPCFPSLSAHLVVAMGTARHWQTLQPASSGD